VKKNKVETIEEETLEEFAENGWLRFSVGIIFVVLAILTLVVCVGGNYISALSGTKNVVLLLLGRCSLILAVFFGIIGTNILASDDYSFFSYKNIFLFLLFLTIPALIHHFNVPVGKELFPDYLKDGNGGGMIGGLTVLLLHKIFDSNLTLIVLVAVLSISCVFLLPFGDIFKLLFWPFAQLKKFLFNRSKRDDEELTEYEQDVVPSDDEEYSEEVCVPAQEKKIPSFIPAEKLIAPGDETKKDVDDFLSARSIIAQRKDSGIENEKQKETSVVGEIYKRKEFKGFSDGVRKENILRRIMSNRSDDNVYNQPGIRENLKENPMNIPDWLGDDNAVVDNTNVHNNGEELEEVASRDICEQKVISLYGDDDEPNVSEVKTGKEDIAIKHYRENSLDDIDIETKDANDRGVNDRLFSQEKPKLSRVRYKYPKVDLLDKPKHLSSAVYERDIQNQCAVLTKTLDDFGVNAKVVGVTRGPSITRLEVVPAPGVKVSSITSLADDIALKLAVGGVRIEAPIPGKAAIGIEVPNVQNDAVYFREIVDADVVKKDQSPLCIGLGKDVSGNVITIDLTKMPHLLVAGSTGSGKSVCINTLISGILYKAHPEEVKLILVDPKVVELSNYNGIPHLLTPVVTDMKKAASALHWARKEMERRYQLFAQNHAREISSYNLGAKEKLPYIVVIIDELSDLMMVARIDVEDAILALAQKARAAGIHLVLATQRPSVDVITGVIKANIPSRISFAVSSQTDSRTILDMSGAEKLIGKGDMLYSPIGSNKPVRVQGAFISDAELNRITEFVVGQNYSSEFVEEVTNQAISSSPDKASGGYDSNCDDDILSDVLRLVMDTGQASASMLQRKFRVGYTRAARLVDTLEEMGVIGPASGSKPRELIMSRQEIEERFLDKFGGR